MRPGLTEASYIAVSTLRQAPPRPITGWAA